MKLGLRTRILLIAGTVMALTLSAITLATSHTFSAAYAEAISERSVSISHELAVQFERLLALGLQPVEIVGFNDQCDAVVQHHADLSYAAVVSPTGELLFRSGNAPGFDDPRALQNAIQTALSGHAAVTTRDGAHLLTLMPVFDHGGTAMGVILVAASQSAIDRRLAHLYWTVVGVGLLFLLFGAGLLHRGLSRFVTRPLQDVVEAVAAMRHSAPAEHKQIKVRAEAELGMLVDGINSLLEQLEFHQQQLLAAREEALSANQAKSEFLATVSHELRTPLNAILGMNAILLRTALDDKQRRCASVVQQAGGKLLELIEEILDFTSIESGGLKLKEETFSLRATVAASTAFAASQAGAKGLDWSLAIDAACPDQVRGDATRLQQIIAHLLGNAIKFTEHGFIRLELRQHDARHILVQVSDSGIGIAPEMQELIFQPFRQADGSHSRKFGGTGLGLTIIRRLVTAMGGTIELESAPGQGSVFQVALPLCVQDTTDATAALPPEN